MKSRYWLSAKSPISKLPSGETTLSVALPNMVVMMPMKSRLKPQVAIRVSIMRP